MVLTPGTLSHDLKAEAQDKIDSAKYDPSKPPKSGVVPCYDPSTMQLLGTCPAMTDKEVGGHIR